MIKFITGNTLANTVRMGARSRRPKAVFLATNETDMLLARTLIAERECRIIPAHNRKNAVQAFHLLLQAGYEGVFTAINTHFAQADNVDIFGQAVGEQEKILGIEGLWEDVKSQGSIPPDQHVHLTFVSNPSEPVNGSDEENERREPNVGMLHALQAMEEVWTGMNPKKDDKDYLREARSGEMYGLGGDD